MHNIWNNDILLHTLVAGGVAVIPTDTIYGIVGRAEDKATVERIYKIRQRDESKPCIILIHNESELNKFGIFLEDSQKEKLKEFKDKPTSFILDCKDEKFAYLHRGIQSLAFRIPQNIELKNLLKQTGPLIAPSANTEGYYPSKNIAEAKNYFGDLVDIYIDGGELSSNASRIIRLSNDGRVDIIRG